MTVLNVADAGIVEGETWYLRLEGILGFVVVVVLIECQR